MVHRLTYDRPMCPAGHPSAREVIAVPEDLPPGATPDPPTGPGGDPSRDGAALANGTRIAGNIAGRLADQARRTANAAKSGRVVSGEGEPGVLDLTPLRELLGELVEELEKLRLRDRVARALRQAADIIDTRTPKR
jgi:hypothetical protein